MLRRKERLLSEVVGIARDWVGVDAAYGKGAYGLPGISRAAGYDQESFRGMQYLESKDIPGMGASGFL